MCLPVHPGVMRWGPIYYPMSGWLFHRERRENRAQGA
uniref:Uncharacterized protein n=1 Tax=Arundo donax TaxID=35708 RepID=A0A0A9HD28_ARUDO